MRKQNATTNGKERLFPRRVPPSLHRRRRLSLSASLSRGLSLLSLSFFAKSNEDVMVFLLCFSSPPFVEGRITYHIERMIQKKDGGEKQNARAHKRQRERKAANARKRLPYVQLYERMSGGIASCLY